MKKSTRSHDDRLLARLTVLVVMAILLNVGMIVFLAAEGIVWAANAAAVVVSCSALWIIRNREKFRGE